MSHQATNWAFNQRGISQGAKIVLYHLADRHNPDYGCFPSQAQLVADTEIPRSSLNRHLDELEAVGLLMRIKRLDEKTKRQMSTRYILGFEEEFTQYVEKPCPTTGHGTQTEQTDAPCPTIGHGSRVPNEGKAVSQIRAKPCPTGGTLTSKGTSNRTGKGSAGDFTTAWNAFWEAYPRDENPQQAKNAFGKAWEAGEALDEILAGVRNMKRRISNPQYFPFAAKFLESAQWKVETPQKPTFVGGKKPITQEDWDSAGPGVREHWRKHRAHDVAAFDRQESEA